MKLKKLIAPTLLEYIDAPKFPFAVADFAAYKGGVLLKSAVKVLSTHSTYTSAARSKKNLDDDNIKILKLRVQVPAGELLDRHRAEDLVVEGILP